jgi:hypothetical protein
LIITVACSRSTVSCRGWHPRDGKYESEHDGAGFQISFNFCCQCVLASTPGRVRPRLEIENASRGCPFAFNWYFASFFWRMRITFGLSSILRLER